VSQSSHRGSPGGSAFREYQRRRAAREARVRAKHPVLGRALLFVQAPPTHEQAWLLGADGERLSAIKLEQHLRGQGVGLLHDRRIPGSRANIDHLAIGPGGVTVIDTKRLRGKVRVRHGGGLFTPRHQTLTVNGRDRTKLVSGVQWQVRVVERVLGGGYSVQGALCFINTDGLPLLGRSGVDDVMVNGPRAVARLARRSGALTPEQIQAVTQRLAYRFPST
jgi:Nuclease-related domain